MILSGSWNLVYVISADVAAFRIQHLYFEQILKLIPGGLLSATALFEVDCCLKSAEGNLTSSGAGLMRHFVDFLQLLIKVQSAASTSNSKNNPIVITTEVLTI